MNELGPILRHVIRTSPLTRLKMQSYQKFIGYAVPVHIHPGTYHHTRLAMIMTKNLSLLYSVLTLQAGSHRPETLTTVAPG